MPAEERRRAERIEVAIPLDVSGDEGSARGETINISMNGVYFRFDSYIDPLTKVRMGLVIPGEVESEDSEKKAMFDGVVVRTEPETEDENISDYRIAVYITYMSKDSREILSDFISRHI
jgi:hypothetical protein